MQKNELWLVLKCYLQTVRILKRLIFIKKNESFHEKIKQHFEKNKKKK